MVDIIKREDGSSECVLDYSTDMQKAVFTILALGAVVCIGVICVAAYFILLLGSDRGEIMECNKWHAQAAEFANNPTSAQFFLTRWQKDQCDAHGITINAPVK